MWTALCKDPFRVFFPLSLLMAIYACVNWILFVFFNTGTYPGMEHARLFVGGFIYFAIFGFLMTAIPKFTESFPLKAGELFAALSIALLVIATTVSKAESLFWLMIVFGWVVLLSFGFQRFRKRKQNPPFTFLFVGIGLFMGLIGSSLIYIQSFTELSTAVAGKILFYDGMVLSLILGVGGRLIPGILGHSDIVLKQRAHYEKPLPFLKVIPLEVYGLATLFIASYLLEVFVSGTVGWLLRAVVASYMAIKYWAIHKKPKEKKIHGHFLRLSCFFIILGLWLAPLIPAHATSMKHLMYIGGYSLMTFLIASRVTLAHTGAGLTMEFKHFPYSFFGGLLLLAAVTRAVATFLPKTYLNHLGYTAICYIFATFLWAVIYIPKMLALPDRRKV